MILHGNYKSSNTSTKPFFPLLRKILLILDRRNKSAHVRTCFTSCLNQFSCNLVNDQKLIWRDSHIMDITCSLVFLCRHKYCLKCQYPFNQFPSPQKHTHKNIHSLKNIFSQGRYHKRKQPCSESPCCAQYSSKMKTNYVKH